MISCVISQPSYKVEIYWFSYNLDSQSGGIEWIARPFSVKVAVRFYEAVGLNKVKYKVYEKDFGCSLFLSWIDRSPHLCWCIYL